MNKELYEKLEPVERVEYLMESRDATTNMGSAGILLIILGMLGGIYTLLLNPGADTATYLAVIFAAAFCLCVADMIITRVCTRKVDAKFEGIALSRIKRKKKGE